MAQHTQSQRIAVGALITSRDLETVSGEPVRVPDAEHLTHLQFRRFAGCPVCNLHLRSVVLRHDEIATAGVREVVVFHSPTDELRPHAAGLPFAVVADPDKQLYVEFGVESAPRALLDPRVWGPILWGVFRDLGPVLRGQRPAPAAGPHGGRIGLPADFLITGDGRVLAVKYGDHAYDQWSVDELLSLARSGREGPALPAGEPR
jgi:peroxiredoxin